jgi:hypothetical protein
MPGFEPRTPIPTAREALDYGDLHGLTADFGLQLDYLNGIVSWGNSEFACSICALAFANGEMPM